MFDLCRSMFVYICVHYGSGSHVSPSMPSIICTRRISALHRVGGLSSLHVMACVMYCRCCLRVITCYQQFVLMVYSIYRSGRHDLRGTLEHVVGGSFVTVCRRTFYAWHILGTQVLRRVLAWCFSIVCKVRVCYIRVASAALS